MIHRPFLLKNKTDVIHVCNGFSPAEMMKSSDK